MAVIFQEKMLANITGFTTSPVTFYQKPAAKTTLVKNITVTNNNSAASTFSIYFNNSAATFGATHILFNSVALAPLQSITYNNFFALGNTLGSFGWLPGTTQMVIWAWGVEVND